MRMLKRLAALVPKGRVLALSTLLAGSAASLQAASFSSNFDDGLPPEAVLFGSALWDPASGVNGSGGLRLTELFNGQMGTMYLTELDGQPITAFTASFKMLIGGGSGADGLSFNAGTQIGGEFEKGLSQR